MYTPPVTPREFVTPEVGEGTLWDPAAEGGADDWGEVVTRYPYRKVGMDHLLSKELISSKNVSKSHVSHSLVLKEYTGL